MTARGSFLFSLSLVLSMGLLGGCAAKTASAPKGVVPTSPFMAQTLSGSYLASMHAQRQQDWAAASRFMSRASDFDQNNEMLRHRGFLLALGSGRMEEARTLAEDIVQTTDDSELALIFLTLDALSGEEGQKAREVVARLPETGFGQYTKPLLQVWTEAAVGEFESALSSLPKTESGVHVAELYDLHAGLLSDFSGDPEQAAFWFDRARRGEISTRSVLTIGNFYERNGEPEKARSLYDRLQELQPGNAFMTQARARLDSGHPPLNPLVRRPADGAALAMFDLAAMLFEKEAYDSALIFARLAQHAQPDSDFVNVLLGDIMTVYKRYDEAMKFYRNVNVKTDLFLASRLRVAETLELSGRIDDAIALLYRLSEKESVRADALMYIGDLYRRNERFGEAVAVYDQAMASIGEPQEQHWPLVYARGVALERINNWPRAEKDLIKALELQPNNPLILNYLGYSWADKGKNLERALSMIQRAVALRPDDGYIIDSFGWVLFKMGQFEKSATFLERAVELVPNDAVVNDHLGDAYWRVGRRLEAEFQWQRALRLTNDTRLKDHIRYKIRTGLPEEKLADTSLSLD